MNTNLEISRAHYMEKKIGCSRLQTWIFADSHKKEDRPHIQVQQHN